MKQNVSNCEGATGRATTKFQEAMAKLTATKDDFGKPLASPGELVGKLKAQKVDVSIDLA